MLKRLAKICAWIFGTLVFVLIILFFYIRSVAVIDPPVPSSLAALQLKVSQPDTGLFTIGNNWFRQSESGLYELYVEGDPFQRGVVNGKLTRDLVHYQEEVFTKQIHELVPSDTYISMLKYMIGYFNRDMDKYVPEEYLLEIYGVSKSASPEFNNIADPYQRILNYHAAHDIGHALQNMSLVGCTSFATWAGSSSDSSLIIGRNFDFYVGDDFARDKIVAFYNPDHGHNFMMVTFGGMTGVLSGMNEAGLTVTINAAKSDIPSSAATPVSLVAREILQYAGNIEEAYQIAAKRKMFVAESFLIGSARDGKAVVIEKTPDDIDVYEPNGNSIVCTNHFQSPKLGATELNREHMKTSASPYRYARARQLLDSNGGNSPEKTAAILRNQRGLQDADLGVGNEKLINQLVAHHGVIFQPEKGLVWISTAPWQLGKFVCYDLNKVFARVMTRNEEIIVDSLTIPADPFVQTEQYHKYNKFSKYRFPFTGRPADLHPDSVVSWNPESYHAYMLAGDKLLEDRDYERAAEMYTLGLTKEVATMQERQHMEENLAKCKEQLK
jgi:isopenicillin-N N-acyltransferase like protein